MKKLLLLFLISLFIGCTSTRFVEYRGQAVIEGKGGTVRNVKGIDIWETGEPNGKYRILGLINQEMIQNNPNILAKSLNNSISESSIVAEAKSTEEMPSFFCPNLAVFPTSVFQPMSMGPTPM